MKQRSLLLAVVLLLAIPCLGQYSFTTIDYPGATATRLIGLNDHFDAVGHYILPGQVRHAMKYSHGVFTQLDPNGLLGNNASSANQINNRGDITGWYMQGGKRHGYLLRDGIVTTIDYPGSATGQVNGVSDTGLVIGQFQNDDGIYHGFTYLDGVFTQLDAPGALDTIPFYINSRGDIAGECDPDPSVVGHGFVLTANGEWMSFDVPGAPENSTLAIGINDHGDILGAYFAPDLRTFIVNRSNVLNADAYTFVNLPGHGAWPETANNAGFFVGYYSNSTGVHGYIASPRPK